MKEHLQQSVFSKQKIVFSLFIMWVIQLLISVTASVEAARPELRRCWGNLVRNAIQQRWLVGVELADSFVGCPIVEMLKCTTGIITPLHERLGDGSPRVTDKSGSFKNLVSQTSLYWLWYDYGLSTSLSWKIKGNSPTEPIQKWKDHFASFLDSPQTVDIDIDQVHLWISEQSRSHR